MNIKQGNTLITVKPDLLAEWDYKQNQKVNIETITCSSRIEVWWKCKKGHEWVAKIVNRVRGNGCPYCSNRKLLKGYNDLATTYSNLAKEWDYDKNLGLTPTDVMGGSAKKVWWKCSKGHEWLTAINDRTGKNYGCPYCSNKRVLSGYNDLATSNPELLDEWCYDKNINIAPTEVLSGSNKKVWWKCNKGHEYQATIHNKVGNNSGCPYCSGNKVLSGYNDLVMIAPELLSEWDYAKNSDISPRELTRGSHTKIWWKCSKGHEWLTAIRGRAGKNCGCPYCSNKRVLSGYNDLATVHPDLVKEWNYKRNININPEEITGGSNKKVWWKCSQGHEWQASINGRVGRNYDCPYCTKQNSSRIYNFKTRALIEGYYKCECQKCGYVNILTIDEMQMHYKECTNT